MEDAEEDPLETTPRADRRISELGRKIFGYVSQLRGQQKLRTPVPRLRIICGELYSLIDEVLMEIERDGKRSREKRR